MKSLVFILFTVCLISCQTGKDKRETEGPVVNSLVVPKFNVDSAYFFVKKQVEFGPRVPGTEAHRNAANYLINQLRKAGGKVVEQDFEAVTFDHQRLKLKNIIASFNSSAPKRVLLAAHWDTRPFADKDKEQADSPFDGANDGASGVGVLLEMSRAMQATPPAIGIDIILFDGEDWGEKNGQQVDLPEGLESWWCLGSQHWAKHKHVRNYSAHYGVLLDMVGAKRAQFFREEGSRYYADGIVTKIWNAAHQIGYSDYFVKQDVPAIIDDHVFINKFANIPTVDIVHYQAGIGFFGDYHHSRKDNLELISKETLTAVGSTLLHVIYTEK